jgi:hypothetical protein
MISGHRRESHSLRAWPRRTFLAGAALLAAASLPQAAEQSVDGGIELKGEVMGLGAPCVQFRIDSGETVSLQGASPQEFQKGMKLSLTGNWLRISNCMQGRAFRVVQHKTL